MYKIDFQSPIHVHFIGIGGISMSGLAAILLDRGFSVSGSDRSESDLTKWLTASGAKIFYGQRASNIKDSVDLVVYTAAIHPDNPEFAEAVSRTIPMMTRAELLGQLMTNYQLPIAVSGTHGKTTTTSMISHILLCRLCRTVSSVSRKTYTVSFSYSSLNLNFNPAYRVMPSLEVYSSVLMLSKYWSRFEGRAVMAASASG